jgi:hypothetical protein
MKDDPKEREKLMRIPIVVTVISAEESEKRDREEFVKVMGELDGRQRSILIACSLRILIEKGEYEQPLFYYDGRERIEKLIVALTTAKLTGFAKIEAETKDLDLLSAQRRQHEEIVSAKETAEHFRNHDDGWLADRALFRYEDGALIIQWLAHIQQNHWESTEIPVDFKKWLFKDRKRWIAQPDSLRSANLI